MTPLPIIAARMVGAGLGDRWAADVLRVAERSEGVANLMRLWDQETDPAERAATMRALGEVLVDRGLRPGRERLWAKEDRG